MDFKFTISYMKSIIFMIRLKIDSHIRVYHLIIEKIFIHVKES